MSIRPSPRPSRFLTKPRIINEDGEDVTPLSLVEETEEEINTRNSLSAVFGIGDNSDESSEVISHVSMLDRRLAPLVSSMDKRLASVVVLTEPSKDELVRGRPSLPSAPAVRHKSFQQEQIDVDADQFRRTLTESELHQLLDLPSTCVMHDDAAVPRILQRTEAYEQLCGMRAGNSRYMERGMVTFNEPLKVKSTQTALIAMNDDGEQATTWQIEDEYERLAAEEEDAAAGGGLAAAVLTAQSASFSVPERDKPNEPATCGLACFSSDVLRRLHATALIVESVLCMNKYQPVLAVYRGRPPPVGGPECGSTVSDLGRGDVGSETSLATMPRLKLFWSYQCEDTTGRPVSSLCCNPGQPDILAVTYAHLSIGEQQGLVCCWSLQNPEHPGRVYRPPFPAVSCDFSRENPALLAVGCYDGSVAMYSLDAASNKPVVDCFTSGESQVHVVWNVKFVAVERAGKPRSELLMSVSQDGRVCQWSSIRGLKANNIMRLQIDPEYQQKSTASRGKTPSAIAARLTPGLHIDFQPADSTQYLVSTDAGPVHRCSTLRTDEYLATYRGHAAATYRVQWSPHLTSVFISCSADGTVRLWHVEQRGAAVITVDSAIRAAVVDVQWSPHCATQFAFCTAQHIEVWDLSWSLLDPYMVHLSAPGAPCNTALIHSTDAPCLLVGDSDGGVSVMHMLNLPPVPDLHCQDMANIVDSKLSRHAAGRSNPTDDSQ